MKRLVIILLALILCAMSMPALGEASGDFIFSRDGYRHLGQFAKDGFWALEEDGLYRFLVTKKLMVQAECTPSAGLLLNDMEAYALNTSGKYPQLIHMNIKTGSAQVVARLNPKMKSLAGIIGNHIYLLGGNAADKKGMTGSVLYRQEIGSDAYTIVHRGIGKVCYFEDHILALGWLDDSVPVECAVITEDSDGTTRVEYMDEYILDVESFENHANLWTCDASEREGSYSTVYLKTYLKIDGDYRSLVYNSWNADEIVPGPLASNGGYWKDIKGIFGEPGNLIHAWNVFLNNQVDKGQTDANLYDICPNYGMHNIKMNFIYKENEHRIYKMQETGDIWTITENIPKGAELLGCTSDKAYLRAKDGSEIFAIELSDA